MPAIQICNGSSAPRSRRSPYVPQAAHSQRHGRRVVTPFSPDPGIARTFCDSASSTMPAGCSRGTHRWPRESHGGPWATGPAEPRQQRSLLMSERTFTQAELNAIVARERRDTEARFAGYDEYKAKAEQLDALTRSTEPPNDDADQADTDQPSGTDAAAPTTEPESGATEGPEASAQDDEIQAENTRLKTQLLRQQISAAAGLAPDLWDRVKGTTPDEIATDAATLVAKFPPKPKPPLGSLKSGASTHDYRSPKERAAAALRGMHRGT